MTLISSDHLTLINVFTVEPENQQHIIDLLKDISEKTLRHLPGCISINVYKSIDGLRVVNSVRWRTRADYEAMYKHPDIINHMREILRYARTDAHIYEIVHTTDF